MRNSAAAAAAAAGLVWTALFIGILRRGFACILRVSDDRRVDI